MSTDDILKVSTALKEAKVPDRGLIPTQPWHKRTCPEKNCIEWAFVLSTYDKPSGMRNGFPIYERTTKWKCESGHRSDTAKLINMDGKVL